jgi:hypothetical protein
MTRYIEDTWVATPYAAAVGRAVAKHPEAKKTAALMRDVYHAGAAEMWGLIAEAMSNDDSAKLCALQDEIMRYANAKGKGLEPDVELQS